jgi:hypothetical protein
MRCQDSASVRTVARADMSKNSVKVWQESGAAIPDSEVPRELRKTPRKSVIVALPDNHVVPHGLLTDRLESEGNDELVNVILACAGQPLGIAALQRRVRDLQVLLAPSGTTAEDLRELAMNQAPGDIITLLSGSPV